MGCLHQILPLKAQGALQNRRWKIVGVRRNGEHQGNKAVYTQWDLNAIELTETDSMHRAYTDLSQMSPSTERGSVHKPQIPNPEAVSN